MCTFIFQTCKYICTKITTGSSIERNPTIRLITIVGNFWLEIHVNTKMPSVLRLTSVDILVISATGPGRTACHGYCC